MAKNNPAVSIVIPLYNAEKYIGECLESILQQTFQDFEVIVVDDCSTDNSVAVVEKFLPHFNERLKIISTEKNSGGASVPRNVGVKVSCGKYLMFVDSDDVITKTALEELYTVAEKFNADVVHCEKYLQVKTEENLLGRNDYELTSPNVKNLVTEPTLISENIGERIFSLQQKQFLVSLWAKLIRRDFFLENNITLLNVLGEDMICTICLVCTAKRYLRVPNIVNIYREFEDSLSHRSKSLGEHLQIWTAALFSGISYLDKFLDNQDFFKQNINAKYVIFDTLFAEFVGNYLLKIYAKMPAPQFDELVRAEFEKVENKSAVMAFIFSKMNVLQLNLLKTAIDRHEIKY